MKNLREFVESLNEAKKNDDMDRIDGKDVDRNGSGGKIGFNEPVDDEAEPDFLPRSQWDINMRRLDLKFKGGDDFFIIGRAGWGKTSIIKSFAKKYGYEVVTQYLDKCEATDLGGIPIAGEDKKTGRARRVTLMPEWAQYIKDHPNQDFLLFFDEMNQAAPDVMNALMPIVNDHKICDEYFDNILVGAAGNFEDENGAVSELSGPLRSRFKPLIEWESGTTKAWENAISYMHRKWDSVVTKEYIDKLAEVVSLFDNPREVERKFLDRYVARFITKGLKYDDVEDIKDHLYRLTSIDEKIENKTNTDIGRSAKNKLDQFAELTFNLVNSGGKASENASNKGRAARKSMDMIPEQVKEALAFMMKNGYMSQIEEDGKRVRYGISKENISVDYFEDNTNMNNEMLRRLIDKFEQDGIRWKFEKDSEWQARGYKDPTADLLIGLDCGKILAELTGGSKTRKKKDYNNN